MGANQSSDHGDGGRGANGRDVKTCYYELLGVDVKASDDDIKKAYRKKALELHPDRNYGNVENTTKLFAEIQSAYEVLSDPQERAWYDSHRDAILRNEDVQGGEHYEHNVRLTTVEDIMRMFMNFDGHLDYSDSQSGFYNSLSGVFDTLAKEEAAACEWEELEPVDYPSFGSSKDTYGDTVKNFYALWSNFATKKTFSWKDVFRYSEAPDRRVRRMMEKENKRFREEGIREFNEAVRALVAFVKKRDPRYTPSKQSDADRQKALREQAAAQAARSRAANEAKLKQTAVPTWATVSDPDNVQLGEEDAEETQEQYECVVCKKKFKSEPQWRAHEKSKKHIKAVQHLRRRMKAEDEALGLDTPNDESNMTTRSPSIVEGNEIEAPFVEVESHPEVEQPAEPKRLTEPLDAEPPPMLDHHEDPPIETSDSESDDEYASREKVEQRILGTHEADIPVTNPPATDSEIEKISHELQSAFVNEDTSASEKPKMGKAKEKRAKKAAEKSTTAEDSQQEFKCATCQACFPSKTRLFNHIKDLGHAKPVPGTGRSAQGKKGKKK
ncbi:hypothetical protein MMC30_003739 [Trapelia coarctata]|nr:hypothetical protein [Trapelia coarctata]